MISSTPRGDNNDHLKIFFAAGEISGDRQAAYLGRAILAYNPDVELFGSGGENMREAGIDIRIQTSHLGCVGFQESFQFIRPLRTILSQLQTLLRKESPNLAVLVDNEGFNGLLAKFLYNEGIPFVYYFPPQVWLWGEWRAKAIARKATAIIPAFPAEEQIYRREGGRVSWFGHPLLDIVKAGCEADAVLSRHGLDPARPLLAIMPGSRFQELQQLLQAMLGAAQIIQKHHPEMQFILPIAAQHLLPAIENEINRTSLRNHITIIDHDVYTCLSRCDVVLLSSGTATLEVALLGVPMVVAYRVKPLTFFLAKRLVKTQYIAMPNILLNERVVPELLQDDVSAERIAAEALSILAQPGRSECMKENLRKVRPLLGTEGAIGRAADFILKEATLALTHRYAVAR